MLYCFFYGISSGLPLLLVGSTLQAWMTESGVDLTLIGAFSLVGLPYSLKFLWSPLLDMYVVPCLGRRRGWVLIFQIMLALSLFSLGQFNPVESPLIIVLMSSLVAFFSASQDIVIDAYRREILSDQELGLGSSLYVNGYRIAIILSGALALRLAEIVTWSQVYSVMAIIMVMLAFIGFFAPKENEADLLLRPINLKTAIIGPFKDYFTRDNAVLILLFILLYKIGDSMASNMTTPFILKMGYTKAQLGDIGKIFGMTATIVGGLLGGALIFKLGLIKSLWFFGILQAVSTFGFILLHENAVSLYLLAAVIAFENLASGMGTSAYAAYMASLTNKKFTGTQYALLTSLMGVPRVIAAAPTGWMVKQMGWNLFFSFCAFIAIPGLMLLWKLERGKLSKK
jgi:PAT family beta-lactamase induction signal transducer AmpG